MILLLDLLFGKDHSSCGRKTDCRRSESTATKGHNGFYQMRDDGVGSGDGEDRFRDTEEVKSTGRGEGLRGH